MVATFHLHYLGHRVKYGNFQVGNTTQQLLSKARACCSIEISESFLFWVILVTYNIGIYICIYIYKVSYIHSFFFIFDYNIFSALNAKHSEIRKNILWNWWVDCFIARSIRIHHITIHFPFDGVFFFFKKTVFPLVSLFLAYRWVNQLRYFW